MQTPNQITPDAFTQRALEAAQERRQQRELELKEQSERAAEQRRKSELDARKYVDDVFAQKLKTRIANLAEREMVHVWKPRPMLGEKIAFSEFRAKCGLTFRVTFDHYETGEFEGGWIYVLLDGQPVEIGDLADLGELLEGRGVGTAPPPACPSLLTPAEAGDSQQIALAG